MSVGVVRLALSWGAQGAGYEVSVSSPHRPGTIRALGAGAQVWVWPSAVERNDWAAMLSAVGAAFARGAEVQMFGGGSGD